MLQLTLFLLPVVRLSCPTALDMLWSKIASPNAGGATCLKVCVDPDSPRKCRAGSDAYVKTMPGPTEFFPSAKYPSVCSKFKVYREFASCLFDGNVAWVVEKVTRSLMGVKRADRPFFKADTVADVLAKEKLHAFRQTWYDKGHLAPASHHSRNEEAWSETFVFPWNAVPQFQTMNQCDWTRIEDLVYDLTGRSSTKNVFVVTGVIYKQHKYHFELHKEVEFFSLPEANYIKHDRGSVAVPTHFYKVIQVVNNNRHIYTSAFVIPNGLGKRAYRLSDYAVDIGKIEEAAKVTFEGIRPFRATICDSFHAQHQQYSVCAETFDTDARVTTRYTDWMNIMKPSSVAEITELVKYALPENLMALLDSFQALQEAGNTQALKLKHFFSELKDKIIQRFDFPGEKISSVAYCEQMKTTDAAIPQDPCESFLDFILSSRY